MVLWGRVSGWLVGRQEGLLYHVPLASLNIVDLLLNYMYASRTLLL